MKRKIFILILLACALPAYGYTVLTDNDPLPGDKASATLSSSATVPFTPGPLLDDFRYDGGANLWNELTGTFGSAAPVGTCAMSFASDPNTTFGRRAYSLKLDYNVSNSNSYSGYYSSLGGASLSSYKYITFWVKGAANGVYFKVQLSNNSVDLNRNKASVYITDYLDGGVTTAWKKVTIPLDAFVNIGDWTNMKEFAIVFENAQSVLNGSPTAGTVYIDNIYFGNLFLGYVRVDAYGDLLGTTALGGNMGNMDSNAPAKVYSFSGATFYGTANGLLSEYVVIRGWAGIFILIGGGSDGWTKITTNFSNYDWMTLWIKAKSSAENPEAIEIQIKDPTGYTPYQLYPFPPPNDRGIKTTWTQYELDMINLSGNHINTAVREIAVVYDKAVINTYAGDKIGGIYVDQVQFENDDFYYNGPGPDLTAPPAPTDFTSNGVAVTNGFTFSQTSTLAVNAMAFNSSAYNNIENVRFEYSQNGVDWYTIGIDYNTSDTTYSVTWNTSGLESNNNYQVRAVAEDPAGNQGIMTAVINCNVNM